MCWPYRFGELCANYVNSNTVPADAWLLESPDHWQPYVLYIIARRHGHVFRMALHNEGDWRMETWQRARRASCHVSIRQSPSCVMPFWTHAKCLLAFISYLPMWIKPKYTSIKTVYSPRFYGGPYLQAKHADVCSGVNCVHAPPARAVTAIFKRLWKIRFMTASAVS